MKHRHMSKAAAYDHARREFYHHRHLSEVRVRIAKEEAMHVGAYFGKGPLEVGMALEDRAWDNWKAWAAQQIEEEQSMRAQMFSGPQNEDAGVSALSTAEFENAVTDLAPMAAATPNTPSSAPPRGGVAAHP
jgi:small subunit ribosomal protein S23